MAEPLSVIDDLPIQFGNIARDFREGATGIATQVSWWLPAHILPANLFLRGAEIHTKISITRTQEHFWFGFFRRDEQTDVVMDASLDAGIRIVDLDFPRAPLTARSVLHIAVVPSFFHVVLTPAETLKAAQVLGTSMDSVFFVRLDMGILAVANPEDFDSARVAWRWDSSASWIRADRPGTTAGTRVWQVPPFLALARSVGLWSKNRFQTGESVPITLPTDAAGPDMKAPLFILRKVTDAWIQMTNAVQDRNEEQKEPSPAVQPLLPEYEISGFSGHLLIRLNPQGQLAWKGQREDLFTLDASVAIEEDENGVVRSTVVIGPPDFLSAGPLYHAFLGCLMEEDAARCIADELGIKGQSQAIRDYLSSARSNDRDAPLVFRVKRGKRDTDLITIHGTLNGLLQHVVLKGEFVVDTSDPEEPKVELHKNNLEVLYTDRPAHPLPEDSGTELVRYFLRLLTHLRSWKGVLI
jgi:hypothetical protein